ncbi:MAG: hypothetical protein UZ08_BCD001001554 [Candidatus Parvibacillus calidus]|nr:MAG: hypothetical protein UZ08_BCD001001554 [Candidatus Parvibacillus calidus]
MFRRLYNRIFLPAIRFILPGITPRKLILAIILSVIFSYFFYLFVTTRVAGKEWKIWLWGLFFGFFRRPLYQGGSKSDQELSIQKKRNNRTHGNQ